MVLAFFHMCTIVGFNIVIMLSVELCQHTKQLKKVQCNVTFTMAYGFSFLLCVVCFQFMNDIQLTLNVRSDDI